MNRRTSILAFVATLLTFACMDVSFAQDVMQPPRLQPNRLPTTSPYLLLGNRSFDPALSYYRIIRPENQIRSAYTSQAQRITQLRSEVNRQQQEIDQAENSLLNPTGHRAMFQNYGGYFGGYSRGTGYFGVQ